MCASVQMKPDGISPRSGGRNKVTRPDSKKLSPPDLHISADLLKGTEEAYRWLGVSWADNRYLVISLSGEIEAKHPKNGVRWLHGWRCRYDLKSGKFDVPGVFAKGNAEALKRTER